VKKLSGSISGSDYDSEEACNKGNLSEDIALRYPPSLAFSDHVDRLNTPDRTPRRVKRAEALHGSDPAFDKFCLIIASPVRLRWVRGPRAGVGVRTDLANLSEDVRKSSGGEHATGTGRFNVGCNRQRTPNGGGIESTNISWTGRGWKSPKLPGRPLTHTIRERNSR
jgi:hypothetical protein